MIHNNHYDVVVIGGGVSGLTSAYRLLQKDPDLNIAILEAKGRVGGRTYSVPLTSEADGACHHWDLGGQWLGPCQRHANELVEELGMETHPYQGHEVTGLKLLREAPNGDIVPSTYFNPGLSLLQLVEMLLIKLEIEVKSRMICRCHGYTSQLAREMDALSVQGFINIRKPSKAVSDLITIMTRVMFGLEPSSISFLHLLLLVKGAGSLDDLISAKESSAQGYMFKGGAQQISLRLRDRIGRDKIHLSTPVTSVVQQEDGQYWVLTRNGDVFHTKYVLVATPPNMTAKLTFSPLLPADKTHCLVRVAPGYIIKTIITYQQSFWTRRGISGELMSTGEYSSSMVTMVFTGTSGYGGHSLVVFCAGHQAICASMLEKNERQAATLQELNRFLGEEVYDFLEYREMDWFREEYTECSPVCCPTPGSLLYRPALHTPYNNIFFAGSESADEWDGFISGAVQAGTRAANEVMYNLDSARITDTDLEHTAYSKLRPQDHQLTPTVTQHISLFVIGCCWWLIYVIKLITFSCFRRDK